METLPMFCNQCQEAARGTGCDKMGVCGKTPEISTELDGLIARLIRLARGAVMAGEITPATAHLIADGLFVTVTNVNFDAESIRAWEARVDAAADALTAGCAKFRYNKLNLGDIGGIPRVLDAGQCNDCYSLAVVALKLTEVFGAESVNDLPLSFDIGWYEQKAVCVLLALLHLGVKGIRLGPTLPAFLSPGVAKVLVDSFGIKGIGTVEEDLPAVMAGA